MSSWHSYASIYALGHAAVKDLLDDPVRVEEKIDGSQFSFGVIDGELKCRSKSAQLNIIAPEDMFRDAVSMVSCIAHALTPEWTYRGEYLAKPKHNALAYDRVPRGNVILFDINIEHEEYLDRMALEAEADRLGLEVVPCLFNGVLAHIELLRELLDTVSILGGQRIEGVVLKSSTMYGRDKKLLMASFVSEAFKEVHNKEWKASNPGGRDLVAQITDDYTTPARWMKAVQHLREAGQLEGSPRDIGPLIKEVQEDVRREEYEAITRRVMEWAWPHVRRGVAHGLAEWYKEHLLETQFE